MSLQKILVALNHAQLSHLIFSQALELARVSQAKLRLFHAIDGGMDVAMPMIPVGVGDYTGLNNYAYGQPLTNLATLNEQAETLLQNYAQQAAEHHLVAEVEHRSGNPGPLLCEVARAWQADLIVVGRRGRRGLTEALLGSVSNYVVHHAPCSVFIVQSAPH